MVLVGLKITDCAVDDDIAAAKHISVKLKLAARKTEMRLKCILKRFWSPGPKGGIYNEAIRKQRLLLLNESGWVAVV
jgi:hypothetical protein